MKTILFFIFLMLLNWDLFSQNSDTANRQLWLLTAKISVNRTYMRETIKSFRIESMQTDNKFHQSAKTSASSTISAVIENQADNPLKDFFYDPSSVEPVSMSVTGKAGEKVTVDSIKTNY